jgi:hypothetical protein
LTSHRIALDAIRRVLGIDGIGAAPRRDVLSATVAVQVKRYDPDSVRAPIGRDTVALLQRAISHHTGPVQSCGEEGGGVVRAEGGSD